MRSLAHFLALARGVGLALLLGVPSLAWARGQPMVNNLDGSHPYFAVIYGRGSPLPKPAPVLSDAMGDVAELRELAARLPVSSVEAHAIVERVAGAEEAWRASCPVAGAEGLCVVMHASRQPCGSAVAAAVPRRVEEKRRALELAAHALRMGRGRWRRGLDVSEASAVEAILARARLLRADAALEASLAPMPKELDFTPPGPGLARREREAAQRRMERDVGRFTAWFERRAASVALLGPYRDLYARHRGKVATIAAMRVGTWFEQFATSQLDAPPPRNPLLALGVDAAALEAAFAEGCPSLDNAEVVLGKAVDSYRACLDEARRSLVLDEVASCEAALARVQPAAFTVASEIVPRPDNASRPAVEAMGLRALPDESLLPAR